MNYFRPKVDKVETKKSSLLFKLERKTKHRDKVNQWNEEIQPWGQP